MTQRALAWIGCWLALTVAAAGQEPAAQGPDTEGESLPQWMRILAGADAEREEELAARIAERQEADDYAEAVAAAEELHSLRERQQGADHWQTSTAEWQTNALRRLAALSADEQAEWREAAQGARQADDLEQRGRYADALPYRERLLELARRILGEDHPGTTPGYNNLAVNLYYRGNYADAESLLQKALGIRRRMLGEEHPDTATSYNNLAHNLKAQGKYAEAQPLLQKALDICRQVLGENHPDTGLSYNDLAGNLEAQGKYGEAHTLYVQALDVCRRVLGDEHPNTATSYNNLAAILYAQGKYSEAQPLYQKALDIYRRVLGDDHPNTAASYNNFAANLKAQGKYAEAHPLYMKALSICRRVLGEEHPNTLRGYSNFASNLKAQGKYAEAHPLFSQALDNSRRVMGNDHPNTASAYNALAHTLSAQGHYAEAHPLWQEALDIRQRVLGDEHPDTAASYNNLAFNLTAQGHYAEALKLLLDAVPAYEAARVRFASCGFDRASVGAERSAYRLLAAVQSRAGRSDDAWQALEADLARGLLDEAGQRIGVRLTPEEDAERRELLAGLARIESQILRLVTMVDRTDEQETELDALLVERSVAEGRVAGLAAALSQREVAALSDVQAAFPTDAAFIAWVDVADEGGGVQEHWGCVLRASGLPVWERLPGNGEERAWIEDDSTLPGQFRAALRDGAPAEDIQSLARRLAAQRIKPLLPHLEGVNRLYVAAVREMAGVPFDVLTDQFTISYIPSGTQLARLRELERPSGQATLLVLGDPVFQRPGDESETPASTLLPPGGLLITQVVRDGNAAKARIEAGDVLLAYAGTELENVQQLGELIAAHVGDESVTVTVWRETEEQPAERQIGPGKLGVAIAHELAPEAIIRRRETDRILAATRGEDWDDLPGTRIEIDGLAELFADDQVTLLADSDASEQRLAVLRDSGKLAQYRYLHLATHGEATQASAFESALVLAQDHLSSADEVASGAAFYDGRVTANEILDNWKLNAELVTLSSCESGLGRPGGGEGFLGFAQALLLAGSRSVCLSLWKVDDTATALLMDRFYRNLLGRRAGLLAPLPKADALAEAKSWLRNLSLAEATQAAADLTGGVARGAGRKTLPLLPPDPKADASNEYATPYAHPTYWAAFVLIGDPE